ncbi:MarR family winged helix-turn-helix transcriptional regulator [Microbacterium wangchenii]|uniref:MarR family winged helix-turn-helix transcriptional regulator n=1 Tax=Microbacterium wangchenii TaxID=2541726 RepID=UPI00164F46EF|nr:MarR family winged helix-turn-helix transcriptional regulator [Microbacterium wangchenii]
MGSHRERVDADAALPPRLAASTPYLLTRAVRAAARLAQDHFGGEALRFSHYVALCWVDHLGPCAQRDLAQAMSADPSDLVTVLGALDDAGLLARTSDPTDRRRNVLAVTDAGRNWLNERHARARDYDAALCASTSDDGAALRRQLAALLASRGGL